MTRSQLELKRARCKISNKGYLSLNIWVIFYHSLTYLTQTLHHHTMTSMIYLPETLHGVKSSNLLYEQLGPYLLCPCYAQRFTQNLKNTH